MYRTYVIYAILNSGAQIREEIRAKSMFGAMAIFDDRIDHLNHILGIMTEDFDEYVNVP